MNNQFSENLKRIRKEQNLSQEQLAFELGVSRQAISKWESGVAYPEMDKIIALCNKFDLNIDDLLHKDIKEIKGEEESKKKLNKTIDDFLKFITDTVNLFSNMNFKSKIKCLIEQAIIIIIFFGIFYAVVNIGHIALFDLLIILPNKIQLFINHFLTYVLALLCFIVLFVIFIHIFKTRYLDYYEKLKESVNKENINIEKSNVEDNIDKQEKIDNKNKILFRKNENKIIIRDPKHSEYKFINSLFKFIITIIKFFALCLAFFVCGMLILLFISFILSFLVFKTGLFFWGLLTTIVSSIVIITIVLLIILNFVFDRKNNKKKIIWSFIVSLAFFGCGIGLILIGTLNFNIMNNNESMLKTVTFEYDMNEDTFFNLYDSYIEYVETDIDNIRVDYKINKYCELYNDEDERYSTGIQAWTYCSNPLKLIKEFIKNINNKKIIPIDSEVKVIVYASKDNIEKLKSNREKHFKNEQTNMNQIIYYQLKIDELENKLANYEIEFSEYEDKIAELNLQIQEYKEIIDSYECE